MKRYRLYSGVEKYATVLLSSGIVASVGITVAARAATVIPDAPPSAASPAQDPVSFVQALQTLSHRYSVAFIVEDEPNSETVPAVTLADALRDSGKAVGEKDVAQSAIQKVADAFDYSSIPSGTTFLLRKKYTQSFGELPSVTLQECVFTVRDTKRAMSALSPNVALENGRGDSLVNRLMQSLTQDQLAAMFNGSTNIGNTSGGKPLRGITMDGVPVEGRQQKSSKGTIELGVPIRSLTPLQRADVQRIAAHYYLQAPLEDLKDASLKLEAVTDPDAVFRFELHQFPGYPAQRILGCVLPAKNGGKTRWYFLFSEYDTTIGMTPTPAAYPQAFAQRYESVGEGSAATRPNDSTKIAEFLSQRSASIRAIDQKGKQAIEETRSRYRKGISKTLTQAADWLNTRPALSGKEARVSVDASLGSKRVTLVGVQRLANISVWTGIARLYDLATRELADGSVALVRPQIKVAREFAEVNGAMEHVLPVPMRSLTRYPQQSAMQRAALLRFRVVAMEKAANSPSGEFTLKDLDAEGQRYLGLMLMNDMAIKSMLDLAKPTPQYVAQFDNLLIIGGLYIAPNGETQFSFSFAKEDNPGALSQGPGFGNVLYKH